MNPNARQIEEAFRTNPALAGLDDPARTIIREQGKVVNIPAGQVIFAPGDPCTLYPLVLKGKIAARKISDTGREIMLYRLGPGDSCILSTAALLAGTAHEAEAAAETDLSVLAIPAPAFRRLIDASPAFRRIAFSTFASRIADLMMLVEDIAFHRLDQRLAQCLLRLAGEDDTVHRTHEALAVEIGTAREVISRLLREFAERGWSESRRGQVIILDREALERLASP